MRPSVSARALESLAHDVYELGYLEQGIGITSGREMTAEEDAERAQEGWTMEADSRDEEAVDVRRWSGSQS